MPTNSLLDLPCTDAPLVPKPITPSEQGKHETPTPASSFEAFARFSRQEARFNASLRREWAKNRVLLEPLNDLHWTNWRGFGPMAP